MATLAYSGERRLGGRPSIGPPKKLTHCRSEVVIKCSSRRLVDIRLVGFCLNSTVEKITVHYHHKCMRVQLQRPPKGCVGLGLGLIHQAGPTPRTNGSNSVNSRLVTMWRPTLSPKITPTRGPIPKPKLLTSSLDPSDLLSQTASISDQPFCHNALDRLTHTQTNTGWRKCSMTIARFRSIESNYAT